MFPTTQGFLVFQQLATTAVLQFRVSCVFSTFKALLLLAVFLTTKAVLLLLTAVFLRLTCFLRVSHNHRILALHSADGRIAQAYVFPADHPTELFVPPTVANDNDSSQGESDSCYSPMAFFHRIRLVLLFLLFLVLFTWRKKESPFGKWHFFSGFPICLFPPAHELSKFSVFRLIKSRGDALLALQRRRGCCANQILSDTRNTPALQTADEIVNCNKVMRPL